MLGLDVGRVLCLLDVELQASRTDGRRRKQPRSPLPPRPICMNSMSR
jgi:hypothetical protein